MSYRQAPPPTHLYKGGRSRVRPPSRRRTAVPRAERGDPLPLTKKKKMNGTRGWGALVDVRPEEPTAVSQSGLAVRSARFHLASDAAAPAPRGVCADITGRRARGSVSSSPRLPLSSRPRRAVGLPGSGGMEALRRLEGSGRSCPWGGHCGSCPGLRGASQASGRGRRWIGL